MSLPASTGQAEQNLDLLGVSCHHLKNDLMDCIRAHGEELSSVSVHGIEPLIRERTQEVMCPKTGKLGSSYVDALQGEDVGMSNFMLSYSWCYLVTDIVTSLVHHCQNWGREELRTYFWICCFCINQHRVKEAQALGINVPFEEFREAFEVRVRGIKHVLALMAPWDQPVYVSRVWCVFEVFTAVNDAECELTVILPPKEMDRFCLSISRGALDRYLWSSLEQLDVQTAEASVAADKDNILRIVAQGVGFDYLNQVVRQQLLRWLAESAWREALQQFSTGDLFGDTAAEIGAQISGFLHRLGHYDKAHQLLTEARAAAASESEEKANLLRVGGQNLEYLHRGEEAAEVYAEACRVLERLGKLESHDGAAILTSWALLEQDEKIEEALQQFRRAWTIRISCGSHNTLDAADLLSMMGVAECKAGLMEPGLRHATEGYELRQRLEGHLATPYGATLMQNLGRCCWLAGDDQRALQHLEESRAVLERTGMLKSAQGANLAQFTAKVHCRLGDPTKELELLYDAKEFSEACGRLRSREGAAILLDLGSALLDAREDPKAQEVLELADQICIENGLDETPLGQLVKKRLGILQKSCCGIS